MAMNISLIFFIVLITNSYCMYCTHNSTVDFPVDKGEAEKFPWMILIYSNTNCIHFFGSLVLPRIVLSSVFYNDWFHGHVFRAYADCYVEYQENMRLSDQSCKQSRDIKNIILANRTEPDHQEYFVFKLSEPFQMTPQVNIMRIRTDEEVNFNDCAIMFHSSVCSTRNNHTIYSQYFVPLSVRLDEEMSVDFNFRVSEGPPFLIDAQNRTYNIKKDAEEWSIGFVGSPIMCKNKNHTTEWLQVGISNFFIEKLPFRKVLTWYGNSTKLMIEDIGSLFVINLVETDN